MQSFARWSRLFICGCFYIDLVPILHFWNLQNRPDRGPLICLKIFLKNSKTCKKVDNAICPINKGRQWCYIPDTYPYWLILSISGQTSVLYPYWFIFNISWQTSVLYWPSLFFEHIVRPQYYKPWVFQFRSDNDTIILRNVGQRISVVVLLASAYGTDGK